MDEQFLNLVNKPGRYIGREVNSQVKDWQKIPVRVALAFPEKYEVGMSNLGIRILYDIFNNQPDSLAERVFAPDTDLEKLLRRENRPLTSLESNRSLNQFDLLGVSLGSELSYTNLLTILSLSRIPLRSAERKEKDPIVLAGGNGACAPEPLSLFCDAFLVGDGEEAILEILACFKEKKDRSERLMALSRIDGVYVPSFYQPDYNSKGEYKGLNPVRTDVPTKIRKRTILDLDKAPFPEKWLVPYLSLVHDRIGLEIMRGCVHRCQFCQARVIYGPCRIRSPQTLLRLAQQAFETSGYEEIALLSLSSGDYPRLKELLEFLEPYCHQKHIRLTYPSLRADTVSLTETAAKSGRKQPALTFAPESAERLRLALGKNLSDADLYAQAQNAQESGWRRLKLYFMLGLPGETEKDLQGIANLIEGLSRLLRLNVSFNTFIPKPHTVLERSPMASREEIAEKVSFLRKCLSKNRFVGLHFHPYDQSLIEGLLCRGDRRLAPVILSAWQKGARFDGEIDRLRFSLWEEALAENGVTAETYLTGKKPTDSLPWQHIVI